MRVIMCSAVLAFALTPASAQESQFAEYQKMTAEGSPVSAGIVPGRFDIPSFAEVASHDGNVGIRRASGSTSAAGRNP